ncbi:putative bifunctional diguanylate cyclase/phosphodiesterase [Azonexus fungiphilus]|uniref:putative bifunctional diguanylate cyclase/phosphodiesterase n=1 Tax=Azonexus fungiphilus TaxID=146940 RepID=UPI00156AFA3D|nr:EAL domain-containing protein [Azonexus fungiphilus]NHC06922.1 EAL domain-containing protein [Azonexus fungiphilus]
MTGDEAQAVARSLAGLSPAVLQRIVLQSGEAVLVTDAGNRIVAANAAFLHLSGYPLEELLGAGPQLLASGRNPPEFYAAMWQSLRESGLWSGEIWDRRKDGNVYSAWLTISEVRDGEGRLTHHVASFADIGERVEATQKLLHLAYHDPLTGLPNRLAFESQIDLAIRSCERDHKQVALMLIDLDHFKAVNDTLGHAIGDELLKRVAVSLRECVRASDIVVRLGGDEFVVVLPDIDNAMTVATLAGKVQRRLAGDCHLIGPHTLYATPSIGISLYPGDGTDRESLLRNADVAMYHAKDGGRNNYQFYARRMNEAAGERLQLENALRQALASITPEDSPFSLHFQPQIDALSGAVIGLEALARWHDPVLGEIPPTRFIRIAEDSGLIQPLGDWILWETCRNIRHFRDAGLHGLRVAVNISAQQLRHENLPRLVRGILDCYDLTPLDLELEITESTAMQNPELTLSVLRQFADMGIMLAIDDFGTGYSSLAYLKHLPIHRLKLDRSFVKDIESDPNDAAICSATVALGHNLGLELVAEGVETEAQRHFLAELGCDALQGFYYSKPLPTWQVAAFVAAHRP